MQSTRFQGATFTYPDAEMFDIVQDELVGGGDVLVETAALGDAPAVQAKVHVGV